jgi:hypothetical protein
MTSGWLPGYHAGLCLGKLVASNWVHRWLTYGLLQVGGGEVVRQSYGLTLQYSALFGLLVLLATPTNDLQIALVSLLTKDRYQIQAFNDWPVLAGTVLHHLCLHCWCCLLPACPSPDASDACSVAA